MESLNKQFIFNAAVMTLGLSLVLAWMGSFAQENAEAIGGDRYLTFLILLLILLPYNFIVSLIHYGVSRLVSNVLLSQIIFNTIGLLFLFAVWLLLKEPIIFVPLSSFIILSAVSLVSTKRAARNNK